MEITFSLAGDDANLGPEEVRAILESARALYQNMPDTAPMRLQIGGNGGMVLEVSQSIGVKP